MAETDFDEAPPDAFTEQALSHILSFKSDPRDSETVLTFVYIYSFEHAFISAIIYELWLLNKLARIICTRGSYYSIHLFFSVTHISAHP